MGEAGKTFFNNHGRPAKNVKCYMILKISSKFFHVIQEGVKSKNYRTTKKIKRFNIFSEIFRKDRNSLQIGEDDLT